MDITVTTFLSVDAVHQGQAARTEDRSSGRTGSLTQPADSSS